MSEYTATVKDGTKVKLNRGFKKFAQKFRMSKDDKIKFLFLLKIIIFFMKHF